MKQKLILLYSLMVCCLQADNTSFIYEVTEENGRWRGRADELLLNGDLTPLDEAFQRQDLLDLWYHFGVAYRGWSESSPMINGKLRPKYTSAEEKALRIKIRTRAGELLSQLPNHAEFMGAYLDRFTTSDESLEYTNVQNCFNLLTKLGSPECIRQLMNYVDDDRRPGDKFWHPGPGGDYSNNRPLQNSYLAILALDTALGGKSPVAADKKSRPEGIIPHDVTVLRPKIKAWWASDAAKPFRDHGSAKNVALAALRQGNVGDSKPVKPSEGDYVRAWNPWLTGGVLTLAILAATWFAAKRR